MLAERWPTTMQVGILTLMFAFGVGTTLGVLAAYHQNSWLDNGLTFLPCWALRYPALCWPLPDFVFSVRLDWLPMRGWGDSGCLINIPGQREGFVCADWVMPVFAYALGPMAIIARFTRASVVDAIRSDFVRTAHAKGLGTRVVVTRHVLKNALIPIITVAGPMIPDLLTGSIFIESTFAINGIGKFFVTSAFNRDYPMIMAIAFLISGIWGLIYLLTDLVYTWVDPRVRLGAEGRS
ncbi:MAG: ABC transporter permease [Caldilineaceae bacterium]